MIFWSFSVTMLAQKSKLKLVDFLVKQSKRELKISWLGVHWYKDSREQNSYEGIMNFTRTLIVYTGLKMNLVRLRISCWDLNESCRAHQGDSGDIKNVENGDRMWNLWSFKDLPEINLDWWRGNTWWRHMAWSATPSFWETRWRGSRNAWHVEPRNGDIWNLL